MSSKNKMIWISSSPRASQVTSSESPGAWRQPGGEKHKENLFLKYQLFNVRCERRRLAFRSGFALNQGPPAAERPVGSEQLCPQQEG